MGARIAVTTKSAATVDARDRVGRAAADGLGA